MALAFLDRLLSQRFGPEWAALTPKQRILVSDDFALMLREDYKTDDLDNLDTDGMASQFFQDAAHDASMEYRRRIGGGNLASYVKCLEVHAK